MNGKIKGILLASSAAICWGTFGTFVTLLSNVGFSADSIAVFCPIALIFLFLISELIHNPKGLKLNKKTFLTCLIVGITSVCGTNLFYVWALSNGISVAVASVITFCNYFIVMVASRFIWKAKITLPKIAAGILALFGVCLLLEVWAGLSIAVIGLIWIIVVTITFAVGYLGNAIAVVNQEMDVDSFFFWINLLGFIPLAFISPPWAVFHEIGVCVANHGIYAVLLLLGLCLIPQLGNYYNEGRAMKYISPAMVSIIFTFDPITAAILGFLVLGQSLHVVQIIGMLVTIAAVIWVQLIEIKETKQALVESNESEDAENVPVS